MKKMLSTKEVAKFLGINEKMVYSLITDKGLPATKITGKWIFPLHLVEQWVDSNTINFPKQTQDHLSFQNLLVIIGSNDPLLERTISLFNQTSDHVTAVFSSIGSMGGLSALKNSVCHIAPCHLLSENEEEYNFDIANQELNAMPAVVNFCMREQGIIMRRRPGVTIQNIEDVFFKGVTIANRPVGTGTRLLFDKELMKVGISADGLNGYTNEFNRHIDIGLEILAGRADAGPGIRAVAALLGLDFWPLRWERYDLLILKERFFDKKVQQFLGMLHEPSFKALFGSDYGYDLQSAGKIVFPGNR